MKRPRPVYVYVEKKSLPKAKKSSSGSGEGGRSRSNTPISSAQEIRKRADEQPKKSSMRTISSSPFGEMSPLKRPTTSLYPQHPNKSRRPSDWSSNGNMRGSSHHVDSSDTPGRKTSSRDSKKDEYYRYTNENNLLNNFEISSSRSHHRNHHHRKRKNYTITLCFDLPTASSYQMAPPMPPCSPPPPPPSPPPPPPVQPLPIRPVASAAFGSQPCCLSTPLTNQTNMSDCLGAYAGYSGNNLSNAFSQQFNWNGQNGYNTQQQNTLGLYGSPMQYGMQASPNFMNPTPQFSNIGSYGSNNFCNNLTNATSNLNYGYGFGFGGDNSSSLNNYGLGYNSAAFSAALSAGFGAAASTPIANTSNAFSTSAALTNENANRFRDNYFSKPTTNGYNYYNSGYPPVSQPPIYSQFTNANYQNNNYLGTLDNLKAQNTYANPYNSGNYYNSGQHHNYNQYNYNSTPNYGYNYKSNSHHTSTSYLNHTTPNYQYNEVYSVPYGTGANFVNELIHRSLQNNQCCAYNSYSYPSSSRQNFNCLCLCFPENFRHPPNAFYHNFQRPTMSRTRYHHRTNRRYGGLYDFSDSDYINNLIC